MSMEGTNFSAPIAVDESTITNTSGTLSIKDGALSADTTGRAKMADAFITPIKTSAIMPISQSFFRYDGTITSGTTPLVNDADASQLYGHRTRQNTEAINDTVTHNITLAAGTYTIFVNAYKDNASAIVECLLDATSLGTVDLYSAGGVNNFLMSFSTGAIAAGTYALKFKCGAKHASSSGYRFSANHIWIKT